MNEPDFDGADEAEWEDRWGLAWGEADWETYLKEQDEHVRRYLVYYESCLDRPDRIDEAARLMGWPLSDDADDEEDESEEEEEGDEEGSDEQDPPYTLHRHPVFIATHALFGSLHHGWDKLVHALGNHIPAGILTGYLGCLHRADQQALLGTQALDLGDYTLAVCQFKRALAELNRALFHLGELDAVRYRMIRAYQTEARRRLFDLREIWLRVMRDCREDAQRSLDGEDT